MSHHEGHDLLHKKTIDFTIFCCQLYVRYMLFFNTTVVVVVVDIEAFHSEK